MRAGLSLTSEKRKEIAEIMEPVCVSVLSRQVQLCFFFNSEKTMPCNDKRTRRTTPYYEDRMQLMEVVCIYFSV